MRSQSSDARDAYISTPAEAAVAAAVGRKVFVPGLSAGTERNGLTESQYYDDYMFV